MYTFHLRHPTISTVSVLAIVLVSSAAVWACTRTFTNTSSWDPELLAHAHEPIPAFPDWQERIIVPPPPSNLSVGTFQDLHTLWKDRAARSPEQVAQINSEISLSGWIIGDSHVQDYFNETKYPATQAYLTEPFDNISISVLVIKERFNRVRPNALFPFLSTTIEVPQHPAYPSGHATQAYFIAFMLGAAVPEQADVFMTDAERIAENREIAGVHYPSDSAAGKIIARQWADIELLDPDRKALIQAVREELMKAQSKNSE